MTEEQIIEMAIQAGLHVATEHRVQARHGSTQMTEREIQMDILRVCKVAGHDGDFNVVGFIALCDRLKQLGAEEERKACKALYEHEDVLAPVGNSAWGEAYQDGWIAGAQAYRDAIQARGEA